MTDNTYQKLVKAHRLLCKLDVDKDETAGVQLTAEEIEELMADHLKLKTIQLMMLDFDAFSQSVTMEI